MGRWVVAVALWALWAPSVAVGHEGTPTLQAVPIDGPIELDGNLDEAAWRNAPVGGDFRQREPAELAPATEPTELRVVYTQDTLYVGVTAFDSEPDKIVTREMGRDVPIRRDDGIVLLIDTFHDHRTAYFFETNATGSRTDGLVTDEGRDFNIDWDGVWQVASRRTAEGWQAEFAIPFRTLRIAAGTTVWGLNVRRMIRRKNEETYWAPIALDADLFRISRAGHLTGLENLRQGLGLNVKPYVTAEATVSDEDGRGEDSEVGLDVKWGVTRGLGLDLTVNTDFAETEVDEQQFNLTRFSLFFPEKREFFLENAGIFEFGSPGERRGPLFRQFFSRRIGIDDERAVPMDWGVRLAGKEGPWSLGLINAQTDELIEEGEDPIAETRWTIARVKRNIGTRSSIGVIATDRARDGGVGDNTTYGVDWNLRPTQRLSVWGFGSKSDEPGVRGDTEIWGTGLEWQGSIWEANLGTVDIGENFDPGAGFLRRSGVRRTVGDLTYRPRPKSEKIRNYFFQLEADVFERPDGFTETLDTEMNIFGIQTEAGDFMTVFTQYREEGLDEPFEIFDGVVIPEGRYRFQDWGLVVRSNDGRPFSFNGFILRGEFYDGNRTSGNLTLRWRPSRFFRSETTWNSVDVDLPHGDFSTNIVRQRWSAALTPDLTASTFLQYNDAEDLVALNFRINWIYRPGADLFVVYNQEWDALDGVSSLHPRARQVIVKFTYLFQR